VEAEWPPERLFAEVDDLATFPEWLSIVRRADPVDAAPDDEGPAWAVELRGRLGPLARSKRLRMVRTVLEPATRSRYERRELDGRQHSPWVLDARVEPLAPRRSRLVMHLHYGGSFGGGLLERMLRDEIERSRPVLLGRVGTPRPT
jgi:hypothetical protein